MPGLVGVIGRIPASVARGRVYRMVNAMCHEANYSKGFWQNELSGVYVGWAGLPGTVPITRPAYSERKDVSVVFSGDDFSAPDTPVNAGRSGGRGDEIASDHLAELCEADPEFPAGLNGRFHGLATNIRSGISVLFNDRYGMHRLYYYQEKDAFYFAAEAKALLAVCPELRSLDPRGLGEFISCGCALENRTLFRNINVLPPASAWKFADGSLQHQKAYFDATEWEGQPALAPDVYYKELRTVFATRLPRYLDGLQKVAVSVTGGLDSRMIMAWHRAAPGSLPCYSFGGMYRDCKDVAIGREVAKACGQQHHVISVGPEFLSNFPRYAERTVYLTDGCVEVNHAPDLYVNEAAARIAPVRVTGNYGGEVLRRVRAFKPGHAESGLFTPDLLPYMQRADATYRSIADIHPLSFAVFRQAPWYQYSLLSLEQTQVAPRSPYLDNELVKTVFRAPASGLTDSVSLRLISDGDPALGRLPTDRGLVYGENGFSMRARQAWIEFTVKAEYAYDYGMPQWVAKADRLMSPLRLERLFLGKHKFCHFRVWYRDVLQRYVREILLDERTLSRPLFRRAAIEGMVRDHLRGVRNCTLGIHKALTLELVHRVFLDAVATPASSQQEQRPDRPEIDLL